MFEEYEVKKLKNEVPRTFFRVKYHPVSAAMLCSLRGCSLESLENHNFNMSKKIIEVKMDKNGRSYFVLSLVSIGLILRLHRCLVLAANFGQFVKQKTAH